MSRRWWRSTLLGAVLAVPAALGAAGTAAAPPAWTTYGNGPERWSLAADEPARVARHFVLPLTGRITSQVLAADGAFFVATSSGQVVSFDGEGVVRWRRELGQLAHVCPQIDGYGITGTGAIDAAARTLYVVDGFGLLHALALGTGAERPGWPVRVFADYEQQLVWGALGLVKGAVYVPTASFCEAPVEAGVHRVDLATRRVSSWTSVPASLGGGGGVWGWGGVAASAEGDALYAVTANAHPGGPNVAESYSESVGYGEHLVRFAPDLRVAAASHPADLVGRLDWDFVGSPLVVRRAGCGELVVAANKSASVYGWRTGTVAKGPAWKVVLEPFDARNPFLSQLAWSPSLSSVYAVSGTQLVRIAIDAGCRPRLAWRVPLGTNTENGSPTIAGGTVWFAVNGKPRLVGHDARTGRRVFSAPLGGTTLVGPTVVGDRLLVGTMNGFVEGFRFPARRVAGAGGAAARGAAGGTASWVGSRYGWLSEAAGVFATDDGGRSWRRIFRLPALALVRTSAAAGVIEIALEPDACMCRTRKLWTRDGGRTWHETNAIGDRFLGSDGLLYWWAGGALYAVPSFPPGPDVALRSKLAASVPDGTVVDAAPVPGGVAALVSSRVHGQGWDTAPRVVLARGTAARVVRLPARDGRVLVGRLEIAWPRLTVRGTDFGAAPMPRTVAWASPDGGRTWSVSQ